MGKKSDAKIKWLKFDSLNSFTINNLWNGLVIKKKHNVSGRTET